MEVALAECWMFVVAATGFCGVVLVTGRLVPVVARRLVRMRCLRPPPLPLVDAVYSASVRRQLVRLRAARADRAEVLANGCLAGHVTERLSEDCVALERAALELMDHADALVRYLHRLRAGVLAAAVGPSCAVHGARLRDARAIEAIKAELLARVEIMLTALEHVPSRVMRLRAREVAGRARAGHSQAADAIRGITTLLSALDAAFDGSVRPARRPGTLNAG
jgi:hypothetical protein